jgi:hypothetical protein
MTAPALPPNLPPSAFPYATETPKTPKQAASAILSNPAAALHIGDRPAPKRRTYSWFRKAVFVMSPFMLKAPIWGTAFTVAGLAAGAGLGVVMGHISPDPAWNLKSGITMGAIGVGMGLGPVLMAGQVVGLIQGISRIKAARLPGGIDALIERRDLRREAKKQEKLRAKLLATPPKHQGPKF